jgi:hypothetical protein
MGKNKPRIAIHRKVNQLLAENGNVCEYWDVDGRSYL